MESKSDYHMQHTFPGIAQEAEKLPEVADLEANSIVCGDARVVLRKVATDSIRHIGTWLITVCVTRLASAPMTNIWKIFRPFGMSANESYSQMENCA